VILFLAMRGRPSESSAPQAIEPEHTVAPPPATTVAPQVELAPLRPESTQTQTPPGVRTTTRPPTIQTTQQTHPNPPPTTTVAQPKPDIF
jgi:hypothetical protein